MEDSTRRNWTLSDALRALPKSSIKIKELLEHEGLKGKPKTVGKCPLALYLRRHWGGYWAVGRNLVVCRRGPKEEEYAPSPKQVVGFVESFDEGFYPTLVSKAAGTTPTPAPSSRRSSTHQPKAGGKPRKQQFTQRFRLMVGR